MNLLLIGLAALVGIIQGQPSQPVASPASIEGVVVRLGTGEPVANANLQLNKEVSEDLRSESQRKLTSDGNGRFVFENVTPGEYRLIATSEAGFVPAEFGQRSPTGQGIPFQITAGQKITGIRLAMSPTGSITGRVYDRDGEPLGKAQVLALRPVYKNGRRSMTIVETVVSDDRGEYRLYWLAPGNYVVAAKPDVSEFPISFGRPDSYSAPVVHVTPPARFGTYEMATSAVIHKRRMKTGEVVEEMYLPVYYPKTVDINSATPVSVTGGATANGVDIATGVGLITPHHIRGRVFDRSGQPVSGAEVTAMPRNADPYFVVPRARSDADGSFDIPGAAPGSYQLFASVAGEARTLNGISSAEMADKDVQIVPIIIIPEFKLSGRFVMEGNVQPGTRSSYPRLGNLIRDPEYIGIFPGFTFNPPAAADGSFTIDGIISGDFRVTLQDVPPDGYVRSMRMGNVDVLNDGLHISVAPESMLEVVIGTNAGRIEGTVVNTRNEPLPNRTVVLVPDVRLRKRIDLYKVASTDSTGAFRMRGITPGDYKLFAWEDVETGAWQNADFIQAYEGAGHPMRISEGSSERLQLPVIP